ncbi:winged helix-turn-helix domain-containing protein [Kitasatospora sp. NPDC088351]|uniref:helix-turn-helix domain-containing protein n=1 Tax=Kitasatospora sp. NPDC088351 TaxID=3155180 RepID=UPI003431D50D
MGGSALDPGPGEDADRADVPRQLHLEGTWRLLKRHGWARQQPARRAIERDDAAVELWRKEVWLQVKALRRLGEPGWPSRTKPGRH